MKSFVYLSIFAVLIFTLSSFATSNAFTSPTYFATIGNNDILYPYDVAVNSAGTIYVAAGDSQTIQIFDSDGVYQSSLDGAFPYRVVIDSAGNIYVLNGNSDGIIQKFNSAGVLQSSFPSIFTTGIALDSAGNIYVLAGDGVQIYNSDGVYQSSVPGISGTGITVDSAGNIYVTNFYTVQKFDSVGTLLLTLGIPDESGSDNSHFEYLQTNPALDSAGNIYVPDMGNQRIQIYNSDGVYQSTLGVTGEPGSDNSHFYLPYNVSFDSAGKIYVADLFNQRVQVFSLPLPSDTTSPEAYNQFDPVTKNVLVYGTDDIDGNLGAITPVITHDGKKEIRTYTIQDTAGNKLVLVEKVKTEGKEIKVDVKSIQYNGGIVTKVDAEKKFEWSLNKNGSIKELEQKMTVGKDDKQKVEAKYDSKKNQTKIESKHPKSKETLTGMILLKMSTSNGSLIISHN